MNKSTDTIRVGIPLTVRRRNGRLKILLPPENALDQETRMQDPHNLKALGRAWAWRRKLESGEVATAGEIGRFHREICQPDLETGIYVIGRAYDPDNATLVDGPQAS